GHRAGLTYRNSGWCHCGFTLVIYFNSLNPPSYPKHLPNRSQYSINIRTSVGQCLIDFELKRYERGFVYDGAGVQKGDELERNSYGVERRQEMKWA
ncbi:hypothetical protein BC938DRAFT_476635, partial [Jimgerdemannia flammicorona]